MLSTRLERHDDENSIRTDNTGKELLEEALSHVRERMSAFLEACGFLVDTLRIELTESAFCRLMIDHKDCSGFTLVEYPTFTYVDYTRYVHGRIFRVPELLQIEDYILRKIESVAESDPEGRVPSLEAEYDVAAIKDPFTRGLQVALNKIDADFADERRFGIESTKPFDRPINAIAALRHMGYQFGRGCKERNLVLLPTTAADRIDVTAFFLIKMGSFGIREDVQYEEKSIPSFESTGGKDWMDRVVELEDHLSGLLERYACVGICTKVDDPWTLVILHSKSEADGSALVESELNTSSFDKRIAYQARKHLWEGRTPSNLQFADTEPTSAIELSHFYLPIEQDQQSHCVCLSDTLVQAQSCLERHVEEDPNRKIIVYIDSRDAEEEGCVGVSFYFSV